MSDDRRAIEEEHANRVREMFAGIAGRYDLLNHLLSGHIDKRARLVGGLRMHWLTAWNALCRCKGDLSLTLSETTGSVGGTDSAPFWKLPARKTRAASPYPCIEVDVCVFGSDARSRSKIASVENLSDVSGGSGILRVLKPGAMCLLSFQHRRPGSPAIHLYFTRYAFLGGSHRGSKSEYQ